MSELLTAAQMRAIEMAAIESGEVTGLELMERAGRGVVEAIFEEWPELAEEHHGLTPVEAVDWGPAPKPPEYFEQDEGALRAVVLCGPGNNGGDGFVVARLLKERGWSVEVFLYGDAEKLPPDAKVNYERWCEMGEVTALDENCLSGCEQPDIVVDAIFGTGLTRAVPKEVKGVFHWLLNYSRPWREEEFGPVRRCREKLVSIDIPSGLCADSGAYLVTENFESRVDESRDEDGRWPDQMAWAAMSDLTVSFHSAKCGHYLRLGASFSRRLKMASIGLKRHDIEHTFGVLSPGDLEKVRLIDPVYAGRQRPARFYFGMLEKSSEHKYHEGHAFILSGGAGKSGAARLAARGALRIGAGLVTLGVPHEAQGEVAAHITALMMREIGDAGALAKILEDDRLNALCLGPGLGLERARKLVPVAVRAEHTPYIVLDADALSAFAAAPDELFEMLHEKCVLTPHEGEFKRLFPDIHAKLVEVPTQAPAYSKVDATREAAKRAGCVVLFKGPDTVIADPSGRCSVNSAHYERSAPWLATAGSGDVLAGFITGLLARGFQPMQAAETAAWLHVECALAFGPGLIAEDLPEMLPEVFGKLGL